MRWLWTAVLGSVALVLAGAWALPRLLPDLDLGLNDLSDLSGIGSLAVGLAALAVAVWTAISQRRGGGGRSGSAGAGSTRNTVSGDVSGTVVQAETIHGGIDLGGSGNADRD
ncbi:hypothetical protein [Nocardiopsis sp. CNT312]|uniref:hypothetical protein n=1 Tax=Nocardiopsis sp. CNT312 TaxID=1137268 RepID=UPI0004B23EB8|nr:hypothetical protein [Nocardiopsis sp. CNT312]